HTSELSFRADDGAKAIDFEVHLPEFVPPGESKSTIIVEEDLTSASPNTISSKIVLKHDILIQGPYPDKYVVVKLNFHESGNDIRIVSEVENLGKKDIGNIQTIFYVNDKNQNVQELETAQTTLSSKENKLLEAHLDRSLLELGEFEVSALTTYDDQTVEVVKKLVVGQPSVDITYFNEYFIAYTVNQYSLELLNKWNSRLENVFVDVEVKKEGQKIDQFRTKSVDLEGDMTKRINDYLDATDKGPGKYTFDMAVNFWNMVRDDQTTFTFESEFVSEKDAQDIEEKSSSLAGKAVQSSGSDSGKSFSMILLWLLVGIVVGSAGFYVLWRYMHRKDYESGEEGVL
ncbi:MAG: hypothetical protein Q7K45_01535, partial [Nanoarchaeota archaeon]|nr:hypothetical protein [Nanoarchaeota archaeon]